jgi:hypothetical protein
MSLLTIVTDALSEVGSINPLPATIINNSDPNAVKALAMLKSIGKDLMKSYGWPGLKSTYTFSTVPNQANYALPSDFRRFAPMTQWDRTSHWPLMGNATDSFWELLQSGFVTFGMRFWFRMQQGQFFMAPTPTDVRTIAFDYYQNTWVASSGGAAQTTFLADTDTVRFLPNAEAEDVMRLGLIYKWKASNGLPYQEDKAAFLSSIDADTFDASSAPMIDVTGLPRQTVTKGLLPDTGYGS